MRRRAALLGLGVGLALADSSIVTLALPEILGQFDVGITTVAWVLTSFNLVLAAVVVPLAYVSRRRPREAFVVGCRRLRGLVAHVRPGAVVRRARRRPLRPGRGRGPARHGCARPARERPRERRGRACASGSRRACSAPRSARRWAACSLRRSAGSGSSSCRCPSRSCSSSRFAALVSRPAPTPAGRPSVSANAALLLVAGGLVAALFLVVLLLVDGWNMSPAAAGLVVTVMPRHGDRRRTTPAALARAGARCRVRRRAPRGWALRARASSSSRLGVDDSAAAPRRGGARPDRRRADGARASRAGRTRSCTAAGRSPRATPASCSGSCSSRPFSRTRSRRTATEAIRAGAAVVLDSRIPPLDKLGVAQDVLAEVDRAHDVGEAARRRASARRAGRTTPTGTRCARACRISSTGR